MTAIVRMIDLDVFVVNLNLSVTKRWEFNIMNSRPIADNAAIPSRVTMISLPHGLFLNTGNKYTMSTGSMLKTIKTVITMTTMLYNVKENNALVFALKTEKTPKAANRQAGIPMNAVLSTLDGDSVARNSHKSLAENDEIALSL
jgi:hypothetical protein